MNVRLFMSAALAALLAWMAPVRAQQLPVEYLTQRDGLGNLSVHALAQDATGYLWVGTENGLFRYNGAQFHRYAQEQGFKDVAILALLVDRRQRIWVGTHDHLYVGIQGRFQPILYQDQGLWADSNQSLGEAPDGSIFITSGKELYHITEKDGSFSASRVFPDGQPLPTPAWHDL